MEIALIDEDYLYQEIFIDHFKIFGTGIVIFPTGNSFIKIGPIEALKFSFVVIEHTLRDMSGVNLVKDIKPSIGAEVCLISTFGNTLSSVQKSALGVSGDFKKLDFKAISDWYSYFKHSRNKKIPDNALNI